MTDNDIIKALGSCPYQRDCVSCDIESCNNSPNHIMKCARDLINRQNAEIDNLNKDLSDTIALNHEERKGLKAEIERLQGELETTRAYLHDNGLEWDLLSYSKRNGG